MPAPTPELDAAIRDLYAAFADRPLRAWTDPCLACCTTREEEAALHAAPLWELPVDTVTTYLRDAMTTWGDERELNHLLPRCLEVCTEVAHEWPSIETFGTAMSRARHSWTGAEQAAVDRALLAMWRWNLTDDGLYDETELLCAIGWATDDLGPCLDAWLEDTSDPATEALVEDLFGYEWQPADQRLGNAFWEGHRHREGPFPRQAQMDQVTRWMASDAVVARLRALVDAGGEVSTWASAALLVLPAPR